MKFATYLSKFAAASASQTLNNPANTVHGCNYLSCSSSARNDSICGLPANSGIGVGMVNNAVNLSRSDISLSLTLVDGYPLSIAQSFPYVNFTTRALYLGTPSDSKIEQEAPGCALMLQYDSATFPYAGQQDPPASFYQNTTTCPQVLSTNGNDLQSIVSAVQSFKYVNGSSLPRCESLAAYVEYKLNNVSLAPFFGPFISVTGGAIAGPDVATRQAQIVYDVPGDITSNSCAPVVPQSYQLYDVTAQKQVMRGYSTSQNQTYGGRDGFTPIISVLYSHEQDSTPDVATFCMHIYDTTGNILPFSSIDSTPTGAAKSVRCLGWAGPVWILASLLAGIWRAL